MISRDPFNTEMPFYQNRESTEIRRPYDRPMSTMGFLYIGKTTFLYWIRVNGQNSSGTMVIDDLQNSAPTLLWRHNDRDGVSNHQPHDCLLNRLFRRRSTETSKLRITGLCVGNSPVTGEFPAQRASNEENVSIWWRHHDVLTAGRWRWVLSAGFPEPSNCLNTVLIYWWFKKVILVI